MAGNVTSLFSIPGNIKQGFLPFCLNPSGNQGINKLTKDGVSSDAKPQFFSFRPSTLESLSEYPNAKITPYPASMERYVESDLANRMIYGYDAKWRLSFNQLMRDIPGIQIREYIPDSRMDQVLNTFSQFMNGFSFAMNDVSSTEVDKDTGDIKVTMSKLGERLKTFCSILKGTWQEMLDPLLSIDGLLGNSTDSFKNFEKHDGSLQNYVLKFPYLMYYLFLSSTTTNIYELPYSGKSILSSDGSQGWNKNGINSLFTEGKTGLAGKLLNFVGKNIRLNTTPTWSPAEGQGLSIDFEVDLFNDRLDTTISNFILINTLIPNNMWIQYHIFQHSPSVYDVKIEGINRLYMCAGKFDCEGLGVLRNPSAKFFDEIKKYQNPNFDAGYMKWSRLIRIPDIYRLKLNFTTLIPMNFNNYLYGYSQNLDMVEYMNNHGIHQDSVRENFINNNVKNFANKVLDAWENAKNTENAKQGLDDAGKESLGDYVAGGGKIDGNGNIVPADGTDDL